MASDKLTSRCVSDLLPGVTCRFGRACCGPRACDFCDREVRVARHGSESCFIVGEGLLGETLGGRRAALTGAGAAVPQFHFSRLGPKGVGKQLGEPNRTKIAEAMTVDNGSPGQIPAGFTYLGQFLDHDLTFDKSGLMEGADISPATLLQSRSPSLDLDSLYGNGPQDPLSAKFYESDGIHLKT